MRLYWKLILNDSAQWHRRCKTSSTQTGNSRQQCRGRQRCRATRYMSWRWAWGSSLAQSEQSVGMFGSRACGWTWSACRNKHADQFHHTQQKYEGKHQGTFLVPTRLTLLRHTPTSCFICVMFWVVQSASKVQKAVYICHNVGGHIPGRQDLLSQDINLDSCINKGCFWELSPMPVKANEVFTSCFSNLSWSRGV